MSVDKSRRSNTTAVLLDITQEQYIESGVDMDYFSYASLVGIRQLVLAVDRQKEVDEKVMAYMIHFPHSRPSENDPIIGQWKDGSFNAWYYLRFRLYFDLLSRARKMAAIDQLLDTHERVKLISSDRLLCSYIESEKVDVDFREGDGSRISLLSKLKLGGQYALHMLKCVMENRRASMPPADILLVDRPSDRRSIENVKDQQANRNVYLGNFKENSSLTINILKEQSPPKTSASSFNKLPDDVSGLHAEGALLRGRLIERYKEGRHYVRKFLKQLDSIKSDNGDRLTPMAIGLLKSYRSSLQLYHWRYRSFVHFFEAHDFKTVVSIDEQGPHIRSILDAANDRGVKTIGVQHGAIHPMNPSHRYTKEDLNYSSPIDLFLCWGRSSAEALISANVFRAGQIMIVGQQRTDEISKLNVSRSSDKKKILIATQPLADHQLMITYLNDTLDVLSQIGYKDEVVIRPHPGEKDLDYVKLGVSAHQDLDIHIEANEDLFIALSKSHLVLTAYSTVGIEAQFFNVPVIIFDYKSEDLLGLASKGVAAAAQDPGSLKSLLIAFNKGRAIIDASKVSAFIAGSVYQIDGMVVDRMDHAIRSLIAGR